jgi:hypothetical protein
MLITTLVVLMSASAHAKKLPHYVFVLPDGYTGWIQIVFDPNHGSPVVVEKGNALVRVGDDGIVHLKTYHTTFVGSTDEFFYEQRDANGRIIRNALPADFTCSIKNSGMDFCFDGSGDLSDGFTVGRATVGKPSDGTPGSAWWLFIGPPALRRKMARPITRNPDPKYPYQIDVPENDPTPERIK